MDFIIALMLFQDGLVNAAIYALIALALVMVFTVTRIVFIPHGVFVSFGALTLASFQAGQPPGTVWLLVCGATILTIMNLWSARDPKKRKTLPRRMLWDAAFPLALAVLGYYAARLQMPLALQVILAVVVMIPLGPMVYRIAFEPIANASVLVLLIVAVAVDFALQGMGLVFFGAEGYRTPAFTSVNFEIGQLLISGQSLFIVASALILIVALYVFFGRTIAGKALRATASNQAGARIVGIRASEAGQLVFLVAATIGAISGVLIAPIATIFYDSGFILGLKGFVAAIIGGMANYPLAAFGALVVGLLESYSSFYASAFKEVIVFTLIIPVLLWRSLAAVHVDEDAEDEE